MSEVKKPMAGEWWKYDDVDGTKFRLYVVGPLRTINQRFMCEDSSGAIEMYDIDPMKWNHLPDCDSFEWNPEVFPQYWTTLDRESNLPSATAFVIRKNKVDWNIVWKNGDHGICMGVVSKWNPSGRTQLTKEQAEALLLPKESPDDWVVQDRVPARAGIDQRAYYHSGDGANISEYSWADAGDMAWHSMPMHGHKHGDIIVHLRCRRKDLPHDRTITITRWLCWNEVGKARLIHAEKPTNGYKHCENRGEEKFEVKES